MSVRFKSGTRIGQKRVRKLADAHPIKFMIPREQYEALEKLSAETGYSKAHWVRHCIRLFMTSTVLFLFSACSSTFYYPGGTTIDGKGVERPYSRKAFHTYGDSIGGTVVDITNNGIRYSSAGGLDHSTGTRIVTREVGSVSRYGITWGFMYGILKNFFGNARGAYDTNQATSVTNAANAPKAAPLPEVGSTIPAQTSAIVTPVP